MRRLYKVVNIDCKIDKSLDSRHPGDADVERALAKVNYRPLLTNWPQKRHDRLFVLRDEYNCALSERYWGATEQSPGRIACGEFKFDHIYAVGIDGLRADVENGVVFVGQSVDWGPGYFPWWLENSGVGFERWEGPNSFIADFGEPQVRQDNVLMMKHPGYDIFGHWLLDFVPQLTLTRYMGLNQGEPMLFSILKPWMRALLDAVPISNAVTYPFQVSEHMNLRMPTGLKNGSALAQPINLVAWNNVRAYFNHLSTARSHATPDKIYVSRRNWGGQRPLQNARSVEELMVEAGFTIFHPEQHDLVEQTRVFSNARLVIGEDGSALHSVIFTRPGAKVGVLMHADRMNLWHAGICDTMGHEIAYYQIKEESGQAFADPAGLRSFLSALLAA